MTGWYPCVKQALLDRGWYYNADTQSPFFDLKWTLRSMECDQELLQPWQLTNHFMKNVAITTKVRDTRSCASASAPSPNLPLISLPLSSVSTNAPSASLRSG